MAQRRTYTHPSGEQVEVGCLGPPGLLVRSFRPLDPRAVETLASCPRCRRLVACWTHPDATIDLTDPMGWDRISLQLRLERWDRARLPARARPGSHQLWGPVWGAVHRCPRGW